jgi:hypothetical protein
MPAGGIRPKYPPARRAGEVRRTGEAGLPRSLIDPGAAFGYHHPVISSQAGAERYGSGFPQTAIALTRCTCLRRYAGAEPMPPEGEFPGVSA